MYDDVLPRYIVMHCLCAWCPRRPKEGDRSPETGIRDGCESPCRCWDLSARAASALNLNWAISQSVMTLSCKFKLTFFLLLCDPVPLFAFWQLFGFFFIIIMGACMPWHRYGRQLLSVCEVNPFLTEPSFQASLSFSCPPFFFPIPIAFLGRGVSLLCALINDITSLPPTFLVLISRSFSYSSEYISVAC